MTSALAFASCCPLVVPEVVPLVVAARPLVEPEVVPPTLPDCVPRGLLLTLLLPPRVVVRPLTVTLLLPALLLLVLLLLVVLPSLSESKSAAEMVGRSWRIHSARPPCSEGVRLGCSLFCCAERVVVLARRGCFLVHGCVPCSWIRPDRLNVQPGKHADKAGSVAREGLGTGTGRPWLLECSRARALEAAVA